MSAPVSADDIVAGADAFLRGKPDVLAVLGSDSQGAWLFQYHLGAPVEGSASVAVVLSSDGGWAGANLHNTLRFPRLLVQVWADPQRDGAGNVLGFGEAIRRATSVWSLIDTYLHRPQGDSQMWASVRTVDCVRLTEPSVSPVPDGDGLVRLQAYYAVTQG